MAADGGKYVTDWVTSHFLCRYCQVGQVRTRIWQAADAAYERVFLRCGDCSREWYINGKPPED